MGMTHGADARVREARASCARQAAIVATLVGAVLLAGCATGGSGQQTFGGWFDRALGRTPAQGPPRTSYAAVAAKVYSEPDAGSMVMGVLTRHEQLRRYQSESGFVYVEAGGNLSGWVPENQLVARRPVPSQSAEVPAETADPSAPGESEAEPPSAGPPTETTPAPDPEAQAPERSIFDPY